MPTTRKISTQHLVFMALMIALNIILSRFLSIAAWNLKIGFAFVPVMGEKGLTPDEAKKLGNDFLEADFKNKVASKPIEYKMMLILANPKDKTDDTTALWSGKHKEVQIATLRVTKYDGEGCNRDVFMPAVLPKGVGAPKDPLFETRNEVYSITFGKRQ